MNVNAKVYRGIEFVTVSELPVQQQLLLQHSLEPERIKILMDGKIQENCIQYKAYSEWHATVYQRSVSAVKPKAVEEPIPLKVVLSKG
jgi:hypothetical protein